MQALSLRSESASETLVLRHVSRALWAAGVIACTLPAIWLGVTGGENRPAPPLPIRAVPTIEGPGFELRQDSKSRSHFESTFRGLTIGLTDRDLFAVVSDAGGPADRTIRLSFPDGDRFRSLAGENARIGVVNHYAGNDPQRWILRSTRYEAVRATEVLPGIDLRLYPNAEGFEYDLVIASGRAPDHIRMEFAGVDKIALTDRGDVLLHAGEHVIQHRAPVVYATVDGERQPVAARLRTVGADAIDIMLDVPQYYSQLVVDPTIAYGGFIGASANSSANAVATDAAGNIYLAGSSPGLGLPSSGWHDATLSKLDPNGNLLYTTRLGGSGADWGSGVSVAPDGSVYLAGTTCSIDFPALYAAQPVYGGQCDAFLAKVDAATGEVLFSTYLGGAGREGLSPLPDPKVVADGASNAHIVGATNSINFPVLNAAYPTKNLGYDAFYAKVSPEGSLLYSTYLGGSADDYASGVAIDSFGNVVVAGSTAATDFPILGSTVTPRGQWPDGFVTAFSPEGTVVYSAALGGRWDDRITGVATDDYGSVYVTGYTKSQDFAGINPGTASLIFPKAFFARLDYTPAAGALSASVKVGTVMTFGGSQGDVPMGIAVDHRTGDAYIAGYTNSQFDFPIVNAPAFGPMAPADAFVTSLSESGVMRYSMKLGGEGHDFGRGVALASNRDVIMVGNSNSGFFPGGPSGSVTSTNNSFYAPSIVVKINSAPATCMLDIDGNGTADALTDGLMLIRYLFGIRGPALTADALGEGATRITPEDIAAFIGAHAYDVDGNGVQDALTDGLLVLRRQFGLTGTAMIDGAIGAGARRTTYFQTLNWLSGCG